MPIFRPPSAEGLIFRPPSESDALIIQATIGCSNNTCSFCYSYKQKKFRVRPLQEILDDLLQAKQIYGTWARKIFLADGDALVMKNRDLLDILNFAYSIFPNLERVGIYACAPNILEREHPLEELKELRQAIHRQQPEEIEMEFGDLLFTLVNLSRFINANPEDALRKSIQKFSTRFRQMEREVVNSNKSLYSMELEEMDQIWENIKKRKQKLEK